VRQFEEGVAQTHAWMYTHNESYNGIGFWGKMGKKAIRKNAMNG